MEMTDAHHHNNINNNNNTTTAKDPETLKGSEAQDATTALDFSDPQGKRSLRKRVLGIIWDSLDKSPAERAFVARADWFILSYCCLAYFVKYLDQTNVSNAYVSGMREDLHMGGNDLNLLTTYWNIGYILGQLPAQLLMTRVRPSIVLPTLQLAWGFLVMGMAGGKNTTTLYAIRFFIGLFEASAYPGIMTLLGNWYTPSELGKRACIFQASSSAAQLFSGYLQAGLYSGMNGRANLAAWRWLFLFDGFIGIPIAVYGYFAIPDSPTASRAWWLKPAHREMAITRMERVGRRPLKKLRWSTFREIFTSWPVYVFSATFVAHVLAIRVYSYFNLWLKATKRYTTEEVNIIPSAGYGLQIVFTLSYAWTSDAIRSRWQVICFAGFVAMIGSIILSVWPEHNISAMMAGWLLTFCETGAGALIVAWINEICSFSAEHRAVIIGVIETVAFTFQAWVPLIEFNTADAPHFPHGYQVTAGMFALVIVFAAVIPFLVKKFPPGEKVARENNTTRPVVGGQQGEPDAGMSI